MNAEVLQAIEDWFKAIEGFTPMIATESGATPITKEGALKLAEKCDQFEVTDESNCPPCKEGWMHPTWLEIGWGDIVECCKSSGKTTNAKWYYFAAYKLDQLHGTSFSKIEGTNLATVLTNGEPTGICILDTD